MKRAPQRLPFIDWVRGLAAVVMLQGHVFDSFLRTELRSGGASTWSQFAGGMPPAVFLFLLGVTFAFLMDSQERKGVDGVARWRAACKRSGYLFAVAFAFRLQLWAFSLGRSPWTDLLRVDVLNAMGLALLVFSGMAFFRTAERIRLCAVLGLAIAAAAPVVSGIDWSGVPAIVRNYLVPDHLFFGFFPWAAYVAFGMSAGSVMRILKPEDMPAAMQWFGWGGLALAFSAWTLSFLNPSLFASSDFWLNSPSLTLIKTGAVMILIAFAWVWNLQTENKFSWIRQFGQTSLLVYWVHIELIYGSALGVFKNRLTVAETVFAAVLTIASMFGLSLAWTHRASFRTPLFAARHSRGQASGD